MQHRSALIAFLVAALVPILGLATFNAVVDPYAITMLTNRVGLNARLTTLEYQTRITKAIGIDRFQPETVVLGSSVIDSGVRIRGSTYVDQDRAAYQRDLRNRDAVTIYNAGVRGGGIYEASAMLRYAARSSRRLRRVYLGLEWGLFTDLKNDAGASQSVAFLQRPWPGLAKYFTWVAVVDSWRTITDNQRDPNWLTNNPNWLQAAGDTLPPNPTAPTLNVAHLITGRTAPETRALYFGLTDASQYQHRVSYLGTERALIRQDALDELARMVAFARANDIELVVFVNPQPALYWAALARGGLWDANQEWRRRLARVTPYYDFSAHMDFGTKNDTYFPADPIHFGPRAGDAILRALQAPASERAALGAVLVNNENVEQNLAARNATLDRWLTDNDYYAAPLEQLTQQPGERRTLPDVLPTLITDTPNNYSIVRMVNRFYVLPATEAPFDLHRVMTDGYAHQGVAPTQAAAEIVARALPGPVIIPPPPGQFLAAEGASNTQGCFDGNEQSFCISAQLGAAVQGAAWFGYQFDTPYAVRRVRVLQSNNPPFRQDAVIVDRSDDGVTWVPAMTAPASLPYGHDLVYVPEGPPARYWRVRAMAPNAAANAQAAWTPMELAFAR